ncbi:MAG: right-handed parallel beta-helix repeat-containing protein, partial [Candidatus Latescibacteria bacterium]|nr:right-handed parallel beta-helix repeat-containing protein [Candidatus Latescibacterota bacterium]
MRFYVATNGRDDWSGRHASPDGNGTDGPFATLERARDAIRSLKGNGNTDGMEVLIREGTYSLHRPLEFSERDGGTRDQPIVYRPYNQESVTLSGGRTLSNFQPVDDEQIRTRLPDRARAHVVQADLVQAGVDDLGAIADVGQRIELFCDGRPMTLARYPNDGFMTIADVSGREPFTVHGIDGDHKGVFTSNDSRLSAWSRETDIRLHGYWFWDWSDGFQKVIRIDETRGEIEVAEPYHNYGYRPGQRFYALNLLCELDQPGEWYLDRERAILYFWPPGNIAESKAVLSVQPSLITFTNANWITVKGLTLEVCRGTALTVDDGEGVRVSNCCIRNTGSWGVTIEGGRRHSVDGTDIYNTGEGGVKLWGGDRISLTAGGHEACNNHVYDFGRLYRTYRPAFSLQGVGNRVAHNKIHEGPHNAIQLKGNDHMIEFNEIFDVCFETGDVGAFYMGRDWTEQGVIIRYNHFHDVKGPGLHGAMGVYLDDAASGVTIFGNIFERVSRAAFVGGGRHNTIENNIFIDCEPAVHI